MAKGPRYRKPLRRREKGLTNYHRRLKLLKSRKLRVIVRASNNHTIVQVVKSKMGGDEVLVSAHSKELKDKFDWKINTGNLPAAYLTGYLAGLRAKQKEIQSAILDLGLFYHKNRIIAAIKGIMETEIAIPHREEIFPDSLEARINGTHIEEYAKLLKKEDSEKYEQVFSGYLKKAKINPQKISDLVKNTKKNIENKA